MRQLLRLGVVTALAVSGLSGCASGGAVGQPSAPPASSGVASSPAVSSTPSASRKMYLLGPHGYGPLKLHMTAQAAMGTGLITTLPSSVGCDTTQLVGAQEASSGHDLDGKVFVSALGVIAIYAYPGVVTPQGIGIGSTYQAVHAAYPDWDPIAGEGNNGRGSAAVPGNPNARFRIVITNGSVLEISLDSNKQNCYE